MKTLILYYTYSGSTERFAQKLAEKTGAEIQQVLDAKRPSTALAYTEGCFNAMRLKPSAIQPVKAALEGYDKLILLSPVWAWHPAPPFNAVVQLLPRDKEVEIYLVSAGGSTKKNMDKIIQTVEARGCHVTQYKDIKTSEI